MRPRPIASRGQVDRERKWRRTLEGIDFAATPAEAWLRIDMRVRLQQRKSGFFYKSAYQVEIAGTSFMSDKVENTNKIELRLQRGVSGGDFDIGTIFPVIFFVMLVMFFSFMVPHTFMTIDNLTSILNDGAVLAIIACGLTVVLVAGEFDLSIASAASFGGA